MAKRDARKCVVAKGMLKPCQSLDELLVMHPGKKPPRGVSLLTWVNIKTWKPSRSFAVISSGKHTDRGVVVNFCPTCGANISKHVKPKTVSRAALNPNSVPKGDTHGR